MGVPILPAGQRNLWPVYTCPVKGGHVNRPAMGWSDPPQAEQYPNVLVSCLPHFSQLSENPVVLGMLTGSGKMRDIGSSSGSCAGLGGAAGAGTGAKPVPPPPPDGDVGADGANPPPVEGYGLGLPLSFFSGSVNPPMIVP